MVLASLRIRRKRTLPSGVSSVFKRVVDFAAAHQWLRRRPLRLLNRRSKQDRRRQWWGARSGRHDGSGPGASIMAMLAALLAHQRKHSRQP
jgi:hypothetical protein